MTAALAIMCVRNEVQHMPRALSHLVRGGFDVHIIDHGSTDGSREAAAAFGDGVVGITDLPWTGVYSQHDQLRAKRAIAESAKAYDWVMHADADEWHVSPRVSGERVVDVLAEADAAGYNAINFREAVFVPLPGQNFERPDYWRLMQAYYFFEPTYPRLVRAWKRDAGLDNLASGGHLLVGEALRIFPRDLVLRHYIVLSQEHARRKYVGRAFSAEDRARGWHGNRVCITDENIALRSGPHIKWLSDPLRNDGFDLSTPTSLHFWEWPASPVTPQPHRST